MQFVNDDMDDELYRRAAEEYPLKVDGADWNKLRKKLDAAGGTSSGKKIRRGIVLLLALIPLLLICTTYINTDPATNKLGELNQSTKNDQAAAEDNNNSSLKENDFNNTILEEKRTVDKDLHTHQSNSQNQNIITNNSIDLVGEIYQGNNRRQKTENILSKNRNKNLRANSYRNDEQTDPASKENVANKEQLTQQETMLAEDKKVSTGKEAIPDNSSVATENNNQLKEEKDQSIKKDSATTPTIVAIAKEKKQQKKEPKIYFGFQAGPDFSMVKSTNTNRAGYSVGLIAGYNLSKRFAIETGLLWDQKKI